MSQRKQKQELGEESLIEPATLGEKVVFSFLSLYVGLSILGLSITSGLSLPSGDLSVREAREILRMKQEAAVVATYRKVLPPKVAELMGKLVMPVIGAGPFRAYAELKKQKYNQQKYTP